MRRGIRPPGIRRKKARIKYMISPESGQPIDERVIKRYEKALEFSDGVGELCCRVGHARHDVLTERCSL
jgi:hypothetical protein